MPAPSVETVPTVTQLYTPTLTALDVLGGSGTVSEIDDKVIELEGFSEAIQAVPHTRGTRTELESRLAWTRTHLRQADAVKNSTRGVWTLTDVGRALLNRGPDETVTMVLAARRAWRLRPSPDKEGDTEIERPDEDPAWQSELLERLLSLTPDQFERLSARLLREAGFVTVKVTGRSGDGGIDGLGVLRISLMSFPVFFQCKRLKGSIGPGVVRDFRGAMAGRGDKGLLITTGSYTREAQREATRDGAPSIDLVDGETLCDLLRQYALGVKSVETVDIDPAFFEQI